MFPIRFCPLLNHRLTISRDVYATIAFLIATTSNMRIELDEKTSRHSWFRVMPRYKVRAESDEIQMNDQVRPATLCSIARVKLAKAYSTETLSFVALSTLFSHLLSHAKQI